MFRKLVLTFGGLGILLTALLWSAGCSINAAALTTKPGEVFTIGVGQTARIAGEDMTVTFNEVVSDSRAPSNVQAIWAGQADSRVTITYQGSTSTVILRESGAVEQGQDTFAGYTLTYSLNPYPVAGKETAQKDYRLTLTVKK